MASKHSYTITFSNNQSEKEAIDFLLNANSSFINPDKESRKIIMEALSIEKKYARAFDLIFIPGYSNKDNYIKFEHINDIVLVELKTTKKKLSNLPYGFFFGATESEFQLAEKLGAGYKFCFVSLHPESKGYTMLTLSDLKKIIKKSRVQYQINL